MYGYVIILRSFKVVIISTVFQFCLSAQVDMTQGFELLGTQRYAEAEKYFKTVLDNEPDNKTAKICLARALGLNGATSEALEIFKDLKLKYPNDFEINLNLAESHMWRKNFVDATVIYQNLLTQRSDDFVANQGLANALSAQKNNTDALNYINKALTIQPKNQGAKISKKYILLGLAAESRTSLDFAQALMFLDQIILDFPKDRDAYLNKAIVFLSDQKYKSAKIIYRFLINKNIDVFEGQMGLAYLSLLKSDYKASLKWVDDAIETAGSLDSMLIKKGLLQKVNILGANQNYTDAQYLIKNIVVDYGENDNTQMAKARMNVWSGKPIVGIQAYNSMEQDGHTSYDHAMGKAEAYRSLKKRSRAINTIDQALEMIPNQPDALRLRRSIYIEKASYFKLNGSTSYDNGENEAKEANILLSLGSAEHINVLLKAGLRETTFLDKNQTKVSSFGLGLKKDLNYRLSLHVSADYFSADENETTKYVDWSGKASINYQLAHRHSINFGYKRELQNYSSSLINSGLMMNHTFLDYNMNIKKGPGFFLQAMHTIQSDANKRNLIFGSIYHQVLRKPVLKLGANYLNISFDQSYPALYFSPSYFNSIEFFLQTTNLEKKDNLIIFDILIALGNQQIENNNWQSTTRVQASIGVRFSDKVYLLGKYQYSDAAQTTATGFQFNAMSAELKWIF